MALGRLRPQKSPKKCGSSLEIAVSIILVSLLMLSNCHCKQGQAVQEQVPFRLAEWSVDKLARLQ